MKSLYEFPDIYDLILRHPPEVVSMEVDSIVRLLAQRQLAGGRVLELACGTCAHGIELAQRGYHVWGLDLSPQMLEGAQKRARVAGVELDLLQGDITDFSLDAEIFDCVIFMSETFPLITEYDDLKSHFAVVRRHLKHGGLYVIDIDSHEHGVGTSYEVWGRKTVPVENGKVEIWHESFPGDWVRGTSHMIMHTRMHIGDEVYETADDWHIRVDSPWNLSVMVDVLEDWSLVGFYSWRDLSKDIVDEKHYFMVLE